jgi:beta-glucanase (GH16 family)
MLCLKLSQVKNADGTFSSVGSEIATVVSFGYGTYEFVAKASCDNSDSAAVGNPISGSITGMFNYATNSITEIDVEVEGCRPTIAQYTSWVLDSKPNEHTTSVPTVAPHAGFHKYKYIWTATDIKFYVDNMLVSTHTKIIPSTPAQFYFNHYGTNSVDWGGLATPGVDRFMFVKSFSFTPA